MENLAVCLAAFLQLTGCYFFFAQPRDRCSAAPDLASWLFLVATLCFLWDTTIYPRRFMHMGRFWHILIEIVASIFLAEVGTVIIWCGLERFLYSLTKELLNLMQRRCHPSLYNLMRLSCQPSPHLYWLSGLITSFVSGSVLWYVLEATDGMYYIRKFSCELRTTMGVSWRMFRCYIRLNTKARRRTLKLCQLTGKMGNCRKASHNYSESEDDGCD